VLRSRPRNPRGRGAVAKYLAPSTRLCAQDDEENVQVAHPANLEFSSDALATAPRSELLACFLVRQESCCSERCQSLVEPMGVRRKRFASSTKSLHGKMRRFPN
jgi:hypothetical protein